MAVILVIMFTCLVHWSEPLNQLTSESVWHPSTLHRFTRPPVLTRPAPLIYGSQSRSAIFHSPLQQQNKQQTPLQQQRPLQQQSLLQQQSHLQTKAVVFPPVTTTPATKFTNSWNVVSSRPRIASNSPEIISSPVRITSNPVISSSTSSNIISNSPLIVSNSNILLNLWNVLLNSTILPVGYSNDLSNYSILSADLPIVPSQNTSSSSIVLLKSSDELLDTSESIISNSSTVISNSSNVISNFSNLITDSSNVITNSSNVITDSSNVITNSSALELPSLQFCNPMASPPCVDAKFGFCINDDEYPLEDVEVATEFSKLADQFSYKLTLEEDEKPSQVNNTNNDDLIQDNACLSITVTIKPLRARNIEGDWRVIVQDVKDIIQRQQVTICSSPDVGCSNPDHFSRVFCFNGRCNQKYVVQKFLAYDPCNPDRDVFVDSFQMQSECNCRILRSPCPVYRYDA